MQSMKAPVIDRDLPDERLLLDYVTGRDPAAFAAIVRRHGPMVWTVCHRVLRRQQDAEDAFQATFLVLMHKARSLGKPQLLGNWLYGVAYRTSIKARLLASRQSKREKPMVAIPVFDAENEATWRDLRPVLDDELHRLPDKYRATVVLCYLEGKSTEEAARALDVPRGTVLSRLAWARQRLRGRLTRRGLTLSSSLLAALLESAFAERAPAASDLAQLVSAEKAYGNPSAAATLLAQHVMKEMRARSLQAAAALLFASMLAAWGGLFLAQRVLAPASSAQYNASGEIYQMQGMWAVAEMELGGKRLTGKNMLFPNLMIRGDMVFQRGWNGQEEALLNLGPLDNRQTADFHPEALQKITRQAIYALEGDTLKIAGRKVPRIVGETSRDPRDYPIIIITAKREKASPPRANP